LEAPRSRSPEASRAWNESGRRQRPILHFWPDFVNRFFRQSA